MTKISVLVITLNAFSPLVSVDIGKFELPFFINNRVLDSLVCHKDLSQPLVKALECTREKEAIYATKMLFNSGGCYADRKIHGTNRWSQHKYGRAIDINVPTPFSKVVNRQHPELVKCFKAQGFEWGGDWKNKDYMHFQIPLKT
jgi:hypothetical protein